MDGHKLRSIHGTRCFFTKNNAIDEITGRLQATRLTWKAWLARANAFKNVDPCRSYASVLQQSTSPTVHKYFETGDNGTATETCQKATKNSFLGTSMQSPYLKSVQCHTANNTSDNQHASFLFKGNRNGKGQTLGSMSDNSTNNCDAKEKINIKTISPDKTPLLVSQSDSVLSQSVFPQSTSDGTDNTDTSDHNQDYSHLLGAPVWGMAYTNHKRNKFILNTVAYNKYQSVDFKNCLSQNSNTFGFIPYNDLMIYTGQEVVWGNVPDIVQAHTLIRRSAMPNFMQLRIPVNSQLNVAAWKKYLHSYWDRQLVDLIQYGFPLDFNREVNLASTYVNHASATQHSQHVSAYIQTEMQYGAIYGPFAHPPSLATCHHFSLEISQIRIREELF